MCTSVKKKNGSTRNLCMFCHKLNAFGKKQLEQQADRLNGIRTNGEMAEWCTDCGVYMDYSGVMEWKRGIYFHLKRMY